jgi:hypothetical protein
MALAALAALSACSEAPTRNAVIAYVTAADQWMERCANQGRSPAKESERREDACIREARNSVEPLYLAAAASTRGQRGTTMYLERYRAEWDAAMTALAHSARTDVRDSTVEEQRKTLHDIAAKLTDR